MLDEHKREGITLLEELYSTQPSDIQRYAYPLLITTEPDGTMIFTLPDYPDIEYAGKDLQGGIIIKERLQEEVLTEPCPVVPSSPENIVVTPGQLLIQVPV